MSLSMRVFVIRYLSPLHLYLQPFPTRSESLFGKRQGPGRRLSPRSPSSRLESPWPAGFFSRQDSNFFFSGWFSWISPLRIISLSIRIIDRARYYSNEKQKGPNSFE